MVTSISFRGGETTGGVSDRKIETAKQETTGGVGARKEQDSIFKTDGELTQDTVCFRSREGQDKQSSTVGTALTIATGVAVLVGLLGIAQKKNWFGNIENEKIKNFLGKITDPCYKACKWVKNNSYDKVAKYFKS